MTEVVKTLPPPTLPLPVLANACFGMTGTVGHIKSSSSTELPWLSKVKPRKEGHKAAVMCHDNNLDLQLNAVASSSSIAWPARACDCTLQGRW